VQSQRESDLYDKGRTSDIFIHKARYNWRDGDQETQRIELTTSAEARELLDTFYKLPQIIE
jgi:Mn-dependent DtxR family transcriptional regulator